MREYEITEDDAEECKKWVEQHYKDYMSRRNKHKSLWLRQQREAKKALDTLDEKLETGVTTDERYTLRASKHEETLARTNKLLKATDTDARRWLELAQETFASAVNLGEVFGMSNDTEARQLMTFLGSNWYLTNKKVALTPREPLHLLHSSNRNLDWRA